MIGEFFVNMQLKRLDKTEYSIYKDLYIPREDGTTSQVDHVVVSKYGIFVVETKNYAGWIFGNETNPKWTQVIYKTKSKFLNPIIQNKGHIKALNSYLNVDAKAYQSIIVFTLRSTLKKVETVTPVIYSIHLVKKIRSYTDVLINEEELILIQNKLTAVGKTSIKGKIKHVEQVKVVIEKENSTKICPRCGKELVTRKGKENSFLGCSGFPKCRYTKSMEM